MPSPFDAEGGRRKPAAVNGSTSASPFEGHAKLNDSKDQTVDVHTENTRYFIITSNTKENVVKSVRNGVWATQRKNEALLTEAFRSAPYVILIFSVNGSDAFQGYARMRSAIGRSQFRGQDPFNGFGRLFDLEWLRLHDLHHREIEHLRNPLSGDRPVRVSRDGQELTNRLGQELCDLIDAHIAEPDRFGGARSRSPRGGRATPSPQNEPEYIRFFLNMSYEDYKQWHGGNKTAYPGPMALLPSMVPPSPVGFTNNDRPAETAAAIPVAEASSKDAPTEPLKALPAPASAPVAQKPPAAAPNSNPQAQDTAKDSGGVTVASTGSIRVTLGRRRA